MHCQHRRLRQRAYPEQGCPSGHPRRRRPESWLAVRRQACTAVYSMSPSHLILILPLYFWAQFTSELYSEPVHVVGHSSSVS